MRKRWRLSGEVAVEMIISKFFPDAAANKQKSRIFSVVSLLIMIDDRALQPAQTHEKCQDLRLFIAAPKDGSLRTNV